MTKIGIVGCDGLNKAWTPEREDKTKYFIKRVLSNAIGVKDSQAFFLIMDLIVEHYQYQNIKTVTIWL